MTAQLPELPGKERREELKTFITAFLTDPMHDDESKNGLTADVFRLARGMLAGMEQEPHGHLYHETAISCSPWIYVQQKLPEYVKGESFEIIPLYAAPVVSEQPAPVVKPVMFIDGDISSEDANKLAKILQDFNAEESIDNGEYGSAYQGAREDLAIWKRRALEAEEKLRTAPVAVPDEWPEKLTWSYQDNMTQAEVMAWNNAIDACRAAMLNHFEQSLAMVNPPVIGWLRADYCDDNRRGDAPLFVLGNKDPSGAWGVKYVPLSSMLNGGKS